MGFALVCPLYSGRRGQTEMGEGGSSGDGRSDLDMEFKEDHDRAQVGGGGLLIISRLRI
jgi:hypothetical protein